MPKLEPPATPDSNSALPAAWLQRADLARTWLPALPRRLAHLEPVYLAAAEGLLADKGGVEAVSTAELMLIVDTAEAFVVGRLLGRRIFRRGVARKVRANGQEELAPAIAAYFTAKNTVRLNLTSLGLERRARDLNLADYLASRSAAAETQQVGAGKANGDVAGPAPEGDADRTTSGQRTASGPTPEPAADLPGPPTVAGDAPVPNLSTDGEARS